MYDAHKILRISWIIGKKINKQDNDPKSSKKASGYLPLSKLDLKVLIREIKN